MESANDGALPMFSAISSSARQLFQILRCINFVSTAQVRVTKEGLHFAAEQSQVMQGMVFLEKALFTAYTYISTEQPSNDHDDEAEAPPFQISLTSLLETLQIFGIHETKDRWNRDSLDGNSNNSFPRLGSRGAYENRVLGMNGVCRLSYAAAGDPLRVILEETGVTTTCALTTYEAESIESIPLQKDALAQKIIMRASWLYDAINELSSTSPTRLIIVSSPTAPYFTLSSTGPLGSATVEFSKDPQLLETFQVSRRIVNIYKYSLIKGASRAMAIATKVSIRTDEQGVLSLQFMIAIDGGGFSFVDFRFVPFLPEAGEEDEEGGFEAAD